VAKGIDRFVTSQKDPTGVPRRRPRHEHQIEESSEGLTSLIEAAIGRFVLALYRRDRQAVRMATTIIADRFADLGWEH
jgi:hypothetical protein